MKALIVQSLTKTFGLFKAVDSITFDVDRGEIFGFLGANGAGKSTTIRMLCGIMPPDSGNASLLGIDVIARPDKVKQAIGYMSQKFSLYGDLTVKENIHFFAGIHRLSRPQLRQRFDHILEMADLKGMGSIRTSELSGGVKQRLALGCSLIHEPEILFLDEPTAGVDPAARRHFWDLIRDLRARGTTVFVTSHYMDEVEQCDRIAMMHRGTIAALDSPASLKKSVIRGAVIHLQCEDPMRALTLLSSYSEFSRIDPFGRGFHAVTKESALPRVNAVMELVRAGLKREGIKVRELKRIEPNLEDVFVNLIGGLEAQA